MWEKAREDFIEGYKNFLLSDDLVDLVQHTVIPYFELFACDLNELMEVISERHDNKNQVLDYIEMIFNSKLYDSVLSVLKTEKTTTDVSLSLTHYLIILIELTKLERYQEIKQKLNNLTINTLTINTSILQDSLLKATDERIQYCVDKIKSIYKDLTTNYQECKNCIFACDELFNNEPPKE